MSRKLSKFIYIKFNFLKNFSNSSFYPVSYKISLIAAVKYPPKVSSKCYCKISTNLMLNLSEIPEIFSKGSISLTQNLSKNFVCLVCPENYHTIIYIKFLGSLKNFVSCILFSFLQNFAHISLKISPEISSKCYRKISTNFALNLSEISKNFSKGFVFLIQNLSKFFLKFCQEFLNVFSIYSENYRKIVYVKFLIFLKNFSNVFKIFSSFQQNFLYIFRKVSSKNFFKVLP